MDALQAYGSLGDLALLLGLSSARAAVAFLLVPLFTADLVPTMVRNALFIAVGLLAIMLQPPAAKLVLTSWEWVTLYMKEAFIGGAIGLLFASVMWAFEAAGQVIDNKVGTTQAQVMDPLTGQQVTLNGALFGRLASFIFMSGGGFMLLIGALVESYSIWPVLSVTPSLAPGGVRVFESELGRIMLLTLLISAPALVMLYVIDAMLGLINRFAQQLNVISLAMSLKAVAAVWIIWVQLFALVQLLQDELLQRGTGVLTMVRQLLVP